MLKSPTNKNHTPAQSMILSFAVLQWTAIATTVSQQREYPTVSSKKGLQVQMVDDALTLGIHHAALNLNIGQVIEPVPTATSLTAVVDGETYYFSSDYLATMDRQIKPLSDAGVIVSLIVLNYEPADEARRRILLHPNYSPACPNRLSAFNPITDEGRNWLSATLELVAQRWSSADSPHGQVWNWIIGNEVNSHWYWCNRGEVSMNDFADDYWQTLQLAWPAIHRQQPAARMFVSLEHHWNIAYPAGNDKRCFAAREFLEYLAGKSANGGAESCEWHVAFHPYPENLFEPRSWLDQSATHDWRTTPRITFRNLEQLTQFLAEPRLLVNGSPRHMILSEQGFHTPDGPDGEIVQAAAYCYAWNKIEKLDGVDAFILHRHVDHAQEGGLRLGLWTRRPESIADPERPKKIYQVFQAAGTPEQSQAFEFSRAIIGD